MSPTIKLSLLALVSTVAAVPHYGHQKHHHKGHGTGTGAYPAYPTGLNSTLPQFPTASAAAVEPTTTLVNTLVSTETIVSTVYASRSAAAGVAEPSVAGVADVASEVCGPSTVVVTATEKVTVTVSASASASSSADAYRKREAVDYSDPSLYANVDWDAVFAKPATTPVATPAAAAVTTSAPVVSAPVAEVASSSAAEVVASSAAPVASSVPVASTSTNTGSYSGAKRGLAYNDVSLCSSFSGSQFGFAYNWAQTESSSLPDGVQFVPMMHKTSDSTAEAFLANVDTAVAKGTNVVMTFNEPDQAEQANMSPEDACTAWSSYIQPITTSHSGVTILSPSVTNGAAPMGLDWLSRFKSGCPGATWHAANIHWYDVYDDQTFDRFKAHVELTISTFNTDVWITEFGLNPGSATAEQAASFLTSALTYLDAKSEVKGYAWFMVGTDTSFNMLNSGSATGKVYASS